MLDVATLVGDGLLALSTMGASYAARRAHKNGKQIREFTEQDLADKIHTAVIEVLASEEGQHLRAIVRSVMHGRRMDDDWT